MASSAALEFALTAPKAEVHLHIEGTLEPELAFRLAARNGLTLPFASPDALRAAMAFHDLQGFLDLYYACAEALRTEDDFAELAFDYLSRAKRAGVVRADISFDPQSHIPRGIAFETVLGGLEKGIARGREELGIDAGLVMCFLRHLPEPDALELFEAARPHLHRIDGVGLDSGERGNPPAKFAKVYAECRAAGKRLTAHAAEEGPAAYVTEALDVLKVERIDHGVRAAEDPEVVARLARDGVPLTVCPVSNVRLGVFKKLEDHTLPVLLAAGVKVCLNSDDPAYFGGYLDHVIREVHRAFGWDLETWHRVLRNSIDACWAPEEKKAGWIRELDAAEARAAGRPTK
ncbi:adenosine deaminase Add [Hyaloraphidium curvatum]|nr:adenosine deaminase Add [Hyaloraphidium curvatum]